MDKISKLKELKELLDNNIISNQEYNYLKEEILEVKTNLIEKEIELIQNNENNGVLTLVYEGMWFLVDVKTKIYKNGVLITTESTKKGFNLKIPIDSTNMELELSLLGIKSTKFKIEEIDLRKNYTMTCFYDRTWGKYSEKFQISENG